MEQVNEQLKEVKKKFPKLACYTNKDYVAVVDSKGWHRYKTEFKPLAYVIPTKLNTCALRENRIKKEKAKLEELKQVSAIILQCFNFIGYKKGVKYIKGFKSITK